MASKVNYRFQQSSQSVDVDNKHRQGCGHWPRMIDCQEANDASAYYPIRQSPPIVAASAGGSASELLFQLQLLLLFIIWATKNTMAAAHKSRGILQPILKPSAGQVSPHPAHRATSRRRRSPRSQLFLSHLTGSHRDCIL